jgi:uncharacterized protein (TIGR00255 family)
MILSMTGYGKAEYEHNHKKLTIEIKSLNSKLTDISTRIPQLYREKEIEIRRQITDLLIRGKIDFSMYFENTGESASAVINEGVVNSYFSALSRVSAALNLPVNERLLQIVMRLPDTVKVNYETLEENEWMMLQEYIGKALKQVNEFRRQEGKALETDIRGSITLIMKLLEDIEPFEEQRITNIKTRLNDNLDSLQLSNGVDVNRFEQELIFYLERLDFNEEKVRLINHCNYFLETMDEPLSNGKKLSFISQEMGREINTIGSKANEGNIQRLVIQMKDALERIKEQVLNVL